MALTRTAFRPVDILVLVFLGATTAVAVARMPDRPAALWVPPINLLIAALVVLLLRPGHGWFGRALREWYPILLLPVLYGSLDLLNGLGDLRVFDTEILVLERWLFGGEPARDWWQRQPSDFWSTVLHGAYWSFYPIVAFPAIWFQWRGDQDALRRTVSWLAATFLVCYATFLVFPVAGPYYTYPRPSAEFLDNPAARLVYGTLATGSSYGAAFPSSHVAAAVVALGAAYRGSRVAGWLLIMPVGLLTVSVVYCQMHYAVDALAGLLVGAGVVAAGIASDRSPHSASSPPR